jgi:hypothetical protein
VAGALAAVDVQDLAGDEMTTQAYSKRGQRPKQQLTWWWQVLDSNQ